MVRRHRNREDGDMSAEASLAQAEADRRAQERKREAEQPVQAKLDRLADEDRLAELFRRAFSEATSAGG
jgi:hypothetical protein